MSKAAQPDEYGPRLHAYLEQHWHAEGTNANAWVNQHPAIQGPTVSRWKTGSVPSLANMRAVADALGVPMIDVLIAAGVLDGDELNREPVAPATPSVDVAIEVDPNLTDLQRRTLRDILASLRAVEAGQTERKRGRTIGTEPAPRRRK